MLYQHCAIYNATHDSAGEPNRQFEGGCDLDWKAT